MAISRNHTPFQYSEYISPLPADELIKIGTIKQQLYNEGVAKVQNQIDTLDQYGFSILKEEDKNYFSQEMDKFMKAINEGAAKTDFANINSLRDLLSVGRPLENDPLILNAIKASQEVQRRQQVMSSLDPKDRGPANDYFYMQDVYDYLSDGKVGSKLSSGKEYMPYIDVNGKIASRIKDLKGDTYKGLYGRYNGLIDEVTIEELTNKKVAEAIQSELDEKELTQLQLNARYSLKNLGPENIQQMAMADFNQRYMEAQKGLETAIPEYNKARIMYQTSPTPFNKQLLDRAEENIENLKIDLESATLNAQRFADIDQIDENVYYPYYLNNYITSKAREYSYRKELHDSKPDEVYMKNLEHNLATIRDRKKFEYDMQLEKVKSANLNPYTGYTYNNNPSKDIEGGTVTYRVPTANGKVGMVLDRLPSFINDIRNQADALEQNTDRNKNKTDQAAITNMRVFADKLTQATTTKTGQAQLKDIYEIIDQYFGNKSRGSMYDKGVWNIMYSLFNNTPIPTDKYGNPIFTDPAVIKAEIGNSVVQPLQKLEQGLFAKRPRTAQRIAINNSLNNTVDLLDMDFVMNPNIFTDDFVQFGQPDFISDALGTRKLAKGTFEEYMTAHPYQQPQAPIK